MDFDIRPSKRPQPPTPPQTPTAPATETTPANVPQPVANTTPAPTRKSHKKLWIFLDVLICLALVVGAYLFWQHKHQVKPAPVQKTASTTPAPIAAAKLPGLQLDTTKNYGNKYADGKLPVGDGKYETTGAKQGYVYACSGYAHNLTVESGGAGKRGPWFINNNTQYDINLKTQVRGSVTWQSQLSNTVNGATRTIVTNDLPNHVTGTFPIQASDPAYVFDRNPNTITAQSLTFGLSASPTYNETPNCMGGQSGVMLTGVALFNALDAAGRDAGAWEVQDSCAGHPQSSGEYHYHTLSSCIKDTSVKTVIGYAMDGFPITGPQVGTGNVLTTADLDECHGIVSAVNLDGKLTTTYHYVMTQDFPYSVSCFRGTAIDPPGQKPAPH